MYRLRILVERNLRLIFEAMGERLLILLPAALAACARFGARASQEAYAVWDHRPTRYLLFTTHPLVLLQAEHLPTRPGQN
jgi:hypothetical protein